jgi:hypothetical protein
MKDFSVGRLFGAVIVPTNSFGYLCKLEDQLACLRCVYEHLHPAGVLVIEERYLSPERLAQMAKPARGRKDLGKSRQPPDWQVHDVQGLHPGD